MAQEPIWAGSSSFSSGDTPWGLYDSDNEFTSSADKFADWAARRLGYPIMSVELQSGSFYACFEEAVTEYSAQVNQFNIKDNLLHLTGQATGSNVTHKRVTPTMGRTVFLSKQYGTINLVEGFGFGGYSPAVSFTLMPIFEDLLRVQAIELNDTIRKSAYTFTLVNNKLRVFPDPTENRTLYFDYVDVSERDNPLITEYSGSADVVSDFSNVPYDNMEYQFINDVGKQWIRKYGLALTKELLGMVRSKYGAIPIPNAETSLDGDTLRGEASAEKEVLTTQLREMLEQTSRRALLEADKDEAEFLQEKLQKVPYPIYVG